VWNYSFGGRSSIVDLYISYLRRKIDDGREPMILHRAGSRLHGATG
jgi:two-component system response regulator TrcR